MRVLMLANDSGGLYKFRKELLERFVQEKYRVYVDIPDDEYISELEEIGCKVHINKYLERRGTNPVNDLKLLRFYYALIKKVAPDVVLTYTIKPNVYGGMVCRRLNIPFIVNITGLGTSIENGGILQKITLVLYKNGIRKSAQVFFQNNRDKKYFEESGIIPEYADVLPGSGVNLYKNAYTPYPENDGEIVFLVVGRIMKDKGIDEILEAAEDISSEYPFCRFRLIGGFDEDYQERIRKAESSGYIEYVGAQKDVYPFYVASHALIHASYHEGMSNVIQEAAATGRPVIASDIPGCREIYEDGVTGIGFEVRNGKSLISAIKKFIELPYEKKAAMGRAGRVKMEREFNRQIVIDKYMQAIERITA